MQSFKEQQGETGKPAEMTNAKKQKYNKKGKTRHLFKKIRDTKGTFHAKMCSIKDRNGMDLIEDIKKRWQEYTEELYNYTKKIFMTQVTTWCDHSPRVRNSGG